MNLLDTFKQIISLVEGNVCNPLVSIEVIRGFFAPPICDYTQPKLRMLPSYALRKRVTGGYFSGTVYVYVSWLSSHEGSDLCFMTRALKGSARVTHYGASNCQLQLLKVEQPFECIPFGCLLKTWLHAILNALVVRESVKQHAHPFPYAFLQGILVFSILDFPWNVAYNVL